MSAYANDLRQRILRAGDQGHHQAESAAAFQVSVATIKEYLKHRSTTDTSLPGQFLAAAKQRAALEAGLPGQLAAH